MPIVYMATNKLNGEKYIGLTMGYLSQRRAKHFYVALKTNAKYHFSRAIRKYGREAFCFEKIAEFDSYAEAAREEARLIGQLMPEYNEARGGLGNPGWKHSDEARIKMSISSMGQVGYWKGKKLPDHVVKLTSERNLQPHRRERWREIAKQGHAATRKIVVCLNDGEQFESITAAADAYRLSSASISSVCLRKRKMAGGKVFRFLGDHSGGVTEADEVRRSVYENRCRTAAIARFALIAERTGAP